MLPCKLGSKGPDVLNLQKALLQAGFLSGNPDGVFGPLTLKAVLAYQAQNGLKDDGIVGPGTYRKLFPQYQPPAAPMAFSSFTHGVDVSHYQGKVDWGKLAAAGFTFAYIKATEGDDAPDAQFEVNWNGVTATPLLRGAYHFFRTNKDPQKQADLFCSRVQKLNAGDLPPVVDIETNDDSGSLPLDQRVALLQKWLTAVQANLGRVPVLYTYRSFFADYFQGSTAFAQYPLWIASYPSDKAVAKIPAQSPVPTASVGLPKGWNKWTFWQYTAKGEASGASSSGGFFDFDVFNGTLADLKAFASAVPKTAAKV